MKQKEHIPKASYGYGGKFGVEKDRMDKVQLNIHCLIAFLSFIHADIKTTSCLLSLLHVQVAMGHDYVADVEKHSSQKDAAKGFGGKYGVQKDRVDKVRRRVDFNFI